MDVIIRNQDTKKLETTCFGLTLAIFRFHLEKKLILRFVTQLMQTHVGVEYSSPTCLVKYGLFYRCEKRIISGSGVSAHVGVAAWWGGA